jgi:hypothetical protein
MRTYIGLNDQNGENGRSMVKCGRNRMARHFCGDRYRASNCTYLGKLRLHACCPQISCSAKRNAYNCIGQLTLEYTRYPRNMLRGIVGSLLCVRGLYITRCPHSLHLICSVPFIGVLAPQSTPSAWHTTLVHHACSLEDNGNADVPPQRYSITWGSFGVSRFGIAFGFCDW